MELLLGILCGIALSLLFSFGPAFFSLLQNSVHYGFKKTMAFVVGVSFSDIIIVALMLTVLRSVDMDSLLHNVWVGTIGGVATGWMAIHTFRRKVKVTRDKKSRLKFRSVGEPRRRELFLHGFVLNFLNPLIWIYWVSLITILSSEFNLTAVERYVFFAGLLAGVLGMDMLKCRLASMLQNMITARLLNIFNRVTGSILMAFAVYLVVSMILYQTNPKIVENEQDSIENRKQMIQKIHNFKRDTAKNDDTSVPLGDTVVVDGDTVVAGAISSDKML